MNLYHKTYFSKEILATGFEDRTGTYMTGIEVSGVWLSDRPLDSNEGADGDVLLVVEIPEEIVSEYEWIEDEKTYREFLVPADVVNQYGTPEIVNELGDDQRVVSEG